MLNVSNAAHDMIIRHILYGMLTRWIPVPFADYIAGNIVRRQMVTGLAEIHSVKLPAASIKILADEDLGCVYGCLVNVLLFPLKLILGKIFLLIRFKRFIDAASRSYHAARLMELALKQKLIDPAGPHSPNVIRAAVDQVCNTYDIAPVSAAFRQVLKKKAGVLKDSAGLFWRSLSSVRGRRNETQVQEAVKEAQVETADSVGGVLAPLRTALEAIPPEHFEKLELAFATILLEKKYSAQLVDRNK
jgi:hypothetical protein